MIAVEIIGTMLVVREFKTALGICSEYKKETSQITRHLDKLHPAESVNTILVNCKSLIKM